MKKEVKKLSLNKFAVSKLNNDMNVIGAGNFNNTTDPWSGLSVSGCKACWNNVILPTINLDAPEGVSGPTRCGAGGTDRMTLWSEA